MSEMKSAWEIAMEKAEKLEKASPEEIRQQQEEKNTMIARALADKLLSGLDIRHWQMDFEKYPAEERTSLRQKVISSLADAIKLEDEERSKDGLSGICSLREETDIHVISGQIIQLLDEYKQAKQALGQKLDKFGWERLRQLGVSGSAIESINSLADSEGQRHIQELAPSYNERLNKLKKELLT